MWPFVLAVFIVIVVLLMWIGQPTGQPKLGLVVDPAALVRGVKRSVSAVKGYVSQVKEEGAAAEEADETEEENFTPGNAAPIYTPRTDIFDSATIGSEAANNLASNAFRTDVENRILSLRMTEPQVLRPSLVLDDHLLGGDHPGRKELQANPFVHIAINNPGELLN